MPTLETVENKFQVTDFSHLLGLKGFSDKLLTTHFKLYEGYVKNTNLLVEQITELVGEGSADKPNLAELKRRFGWEYNGVKLHELYFGNMTKNSGALHDQFRIEIEKSFSSWDSWKSDFLGTAAMRGIGWVVTYQDSITGRLFNCWINEHDAGHLAGARPLLVLDVFEHAYIADYGIDRKQYVTNFFEQIDWNVVASRLKTKN